MHTPTSSYDGGSKWQDEKDTTAMMTLRPLQLL